MSQPLTKTLSGFLLLFSLYHAAEYMILFHNSPLGFLGFQLLFFVAAYFIARWQGGSGLGTWGLSFNRRTLVELPPGMLMGIILYALTLGVNVLLHVERVGPLPGWGRIAMPLGLFAFGNLFSSFSEDVLTRGYVYRHLQGKMRSGWLAGASALVYLLNHIYRLGDGPSTYLYLFMLGVVLVLPLLITGRLWFTGGLHWAGNVCFYLTHELWQTTGGTNNFPANYVFALILLAIIPLVIYMSSRVVAGARNQRFVPATLRQ